MRRAAKIDSNQPEIVAALRRVGVYVEVIGKPLDLLICHRGETSLMEVKNIEGRDRLTKDQIEFIARWPGKVHVVRSPEQAIEALINAKQTA